MKTVLPFPIDANGLPVGHETALHAACQECRDWINGLPEHLFHITADDVELGVERIIARYRLTLRRLRDQR